jgi:ACR3 family arsenite transporter
VVLCLVVPVIVAQFWRHMLLAKGGQIALARTLRASAPLSLSALLLTLVLLFGLQGEQIMRQPLVIALLAVPILIQVYFNAGLAYWPEPPSRRRVVRRRTLGADRSQQLF